MKNASMEYFSKSILDGGVTVITGAGVSTDSGLPDFRGREGLWTEGDLATLLTAEGARDRFDEFTRFCKLALREIVDHKPNMTHVVLAQLQKAGITGTILTQNVDGYHQLAGATDVIEAHGSMRSIGCIGCGAAHVVSSYLKEGGEVCIWCGGRVRPRVILFGEPLGKDILKRSFETAAGTRLLIAIGTSMEVAPISLVVETCVSRGGQYVVINRDETQHDAIATRIFRGEIEETVHDLYDWLVKRGRWKYELLEYQEAWVENKAVMGV